MGNKKNSILSDSTKRVLILILGGVCSTLILIFSVLTIAAISKGDLQKAPYFLVWVFLSMGLSSVLIYLQNKNKFNLMRTIFLLVCNIALGVVVLFAQRDLYLFSLTAGLYCLVIIVTRVMKIFEKRSVRAVVFNLIFITFVVGLSVGLFIPVETNAIGYVVLIECLFIAFNALFEVATVAFSQLKFKVLFKIIINTFALEVLFGLLATMVAGALVLLMVEDREVFKNFGDSLWYCFTVVTTIGFGDLTAKTLIGRVVSVFLGMYGIVAVAVITSIIVNFYNETSGKKDAKEIKNIQKEEKDDHH